MSVTEIKIEENVRIRNFRLDFVKSVAVFFMIIAHLTPMFNSTELNSNFLVRLISSLPAPIFLFLIGYNLKNNSVFNFKKNLIRGLIFLSNAILIDVFLWKIIPFYSFDIFYMISFSILTFSFWKKINQKLILITLLTIIFFSFGLFTPFFYSNELNEIELINFNNFNIIELLYNFFINGWFPFFPWFSIVLFGYLIQDYKLQKKINPLFIGVFIFLFLLLSKLNFNIRELAIEIFYPVKIIYYLLVISLLFLINSFLDKKIFFINIISTFGRNSFLLYSFHLIIIHNLFNPVFQIVNQNHLLVYGIFISICILFSLILDYIKSKIILKNLFLKIILGS